MSAQDKLNQNEFENLLESLSNNLRYLQDINRIREAPTIYKGYLSLGTDLEQDQNYLAAIKVLRECIRQDKNILFAYVRLGVCYLRLGDEYKAFICMFQTWMLYHQHETNLVASVVGGGEFPFINIIDGMSASYMPVQSSVSNTFSHKEAEITYSIGCKCIEHRYIEGAVACFDLTIKMNPQDYKGYSNLGTCLEDLKKFSEAIPPLINALNLYPNDEISLAGLSFGFLVLDYPDLAEACASQALKIKSDYEKAQDLVAISHSLKKIVYYKDNAQGLYGDSRMTCFVMTPESRQNFREAYLLSHNIHSVHSADFVRGYGAGLETELRFFLSSIAATTSPSTKIDQGIFKKDLTLGSIAMLIGSGFVDILEDKPYKAQKPRSAIQEYLKQRYFMTDQEIQMMANVIGTISILRNKAAHGEMITTREAANCELFTQVCLEQVMRLRLNKIFGGRYEYTKTASWQTNNGRKMRIL
jgi:tetratricopeptide (TPR) repeat protein